jgi:hypothetical protein
VSYLIHHAPLGGYIEKRDGMNIGHQNPHLATRFATREEAHAARPGHHRDMGGSGFKGRIVSADEAFASWAWET